MRNTGAFVQAFGMGGASIQARQHNSIVDIPDNWPPPYPLLHGTQTRDHSRLLDHRYSREELTPCGLNSWWGNPSMFFCWFMLNI